MCEYWHQYPFSFFYVFSSFSILKSGFRRRDHKVSSHGPRSRLMLKLTITPEFCNTVSMALAREKEEKNRLVDSIVPQPALEKCSASNFSASSLTIGTWQKFSEREGDLVGKCYFKKKKLVWEILYGNRKSKIEIAFLNITAIKAIIKDNEPEELKIELKDLPDFAIEAPPQPRKQTIWQLDALDFTNRQALICRRHVMKCRPGTLEKHYNQLLQSSSHLLELSRRLFPTDEYPAFSMISELSFQCNSFAGSPVDSLIKVDCERLNDFVQQHPYSSNELNAPETSGSNPNGENFITGDFNWNYPVNLTQSSISQDNDAMSNLEFGNDIANEIALPIMESSTVMPSSEQFEAHSWVQTCQNNGMSDLEFGDNMFDEFALPIMVSPPSFAVQSSEYFVANSHLPLVEQSWLNTCQDDIGTNTLELVDDMSKEVEPAILVSSSFIEPSSSKHFVTNVHGSIEKSCHKTCQNNIPLNTLKIVDDMSKNVTPPTKAMHCQRDISYPDR